MYLNRCQTQGKDLVVRPLRVAIHVEQDVDAVCVGTVGGLAVALDA